MQVIRRTVDMQQVGRFGLLTAQIVYRMPDHHSIFQDYIWQEYDTFPEFPTLQKFLYFWVEKIEGPIHSVTVAHAALIKPREVMLLGDKPILFN